MINNSIKVWFYHLTTYNCIKIIAKKLILKCNDISLKSTFKMKKVGNNSFARYYQRTKNRYKRGFERYQILSEQEKEKNRQHSHERSSRTWKKGWFSTACNFQSMKSSVELNSLLSKFFRYIIWLLHQLIIRDTGRLANEAFMSNPIVSSKQ